MVLRRVLSSTVAVAGAAALTACSTMLAGTPVSVFADPFKVAGMQAVDGPTGLRPDAEPPTREVEGTDGGEIDEIAAQSVSDIEQFWQGAFSQTFPVSSPRCRR